MQPVISVTNLSKTYETGFEALKDVNLEIRPGEIFALLGPNGAGKTTLINIVCGIVNTTSGTITVGGHDIRKDARAARAFLRMSWPPTVMAPPLGLTMPQTMLISVVLPAPFGPSSAKISPRLISRFVRFSASKPDA